MCILACKPRLLSGEVSAVFFKVEYPVLVDS